ncbi:hypothetical protein [Athalassotoga sp.]|uniref:hypothetical protein n=1 Tax=Athalassotoga sp. TaxID=2022597 RepID=UPI003D091B71
MIFGKISDVFRSLFLKRRTNAFLDHPVIDPDAFEYVGVIQFQHQNFKNSKDFHTKVLSLVKAAKTEGAQIVLFPAGMNMELYSVPEENLSGNQISKIEDECLKIFSNVASIEKIYVGYADLVKGMKIYHFINGNGKSVEGNTFTIYNVKVAFMDDEIDEDVDLILNPCLTKKWVGDYESFGHAWLYSQQRYSYSMESYMVGDHFTGQSGIYAPIEATDSMSGIIKQTQSKILEETLVAKIDFSILEAVKRKKNVKDEYARLLYNK